MRFAVESWAPEYGIAVDGTHLDDTGGSVDVALEAEPDEWAPIAPTPGELPEVVLFVDGVRRIDARIWFHDDDVVRPGVCATVAAGSVMCRGREAFVHEVQVQRGFFARSATTAGPIATRHGAYQYFPCAGDTAEDLYLGIHEQMTAVESHVATGHDADLVVFDGPLRHRNDPKAVGYVKTQQVQYLPDDQQAVVARLAAGERTPLFLIGGRGTRFSWYVRLPGPRSQPLSGVVRLELPAVGAVPAAAARADAVTVLLQRFASEPHKDPRAPQNLYPIGGLEYRLRHLLGDQYLMERALRTAAVGR